MHKKNIGIYTIIVIIIITVATERVYYSLTKNSPKTASPNNPNTSIQFPSLYSGFKWKQIDQKVKTSFYNKNGENIELDGYTSNSETLTSYPDDFIAYYKNELVAKGWVQNSFAGSGISGDFYFYEKDGRYINFGVFVSRENGTGKILGRYTAFVEHN